MKRTNKNANIFNVFIGFLTKNGNKLRAEKLCLSILVSLKNELKKNPFYILESCIRRIRPIVSFKPKKIAGITYKLPMLLSTKRANSLAVRWLLEAARKRHEKGIARKLVKEIKVVYAGKGSPYKKKKELHNIVLANRAFLKYLKKR